MQSELQEEKCEDTKIGNSEDPGELSSTIKAAFVGAMATLLLTPFSVWIGFSLNSIFARPILSIEHVGISQLISHPDFSETIITIPNVDPNGQPIVSLQELGRVSFRGLPESDTWVQLAKKIETRWQTTHDELENLIIPEELDTEWIQGHARILGMTRIDINLASARTGSDFNAFIASLASSRRLEVSKNLQTIRDIIKRVRSERTCSTFFQVMILNRGDSFGLVRHIASVKLHDGNSIEVEISEPPDFSANSYNSIPVDVQNPQFSLVSPSTSLGQIPPKSMEVLWYRPTEPICDDSFADFRINSHIGKKLIYKTPG